MVYGRTKHGSRFQMHKAMIPVDSRLRSENFIAPHPPRAQVRKVTWKKLAQIPPLRLVGAARRLINISEIPPAPGGVLRATTSPLLMLIELLRIFFYGCSRPDLGAPESGPAPGSSDSLPNSADRVDPMLDEPTHYAAQRQPDI